MQEYDILMKYMNAKEICTQILHVLQAATIFHAENYFLYKRKVKTSFGIWCLNTESNKMHCVLISSVTLLRSAMETD